jgi:Non-ribosomal peptide synthetase modules and related proteins
LIIHERFERQVDKTPNNVALIASDETLTYEQLDQKANRIANALIKLGVKPKSRILIIAYLETAILFHQYSVC